MNLREGRYIKLCRVRGSAGYGKGTITANERSP